MLEHTRCDTELTRQHVAILVHDILCGG